MTGASPNPPEPASGPKGPEAFRTISEASSELGVPQHVLRFWETKFSFIRPMKRAGGRRFYRRQDLAVLKGVRTLLHEEGYTIKGVQRLHKEQGMRRLIGAGEGDIPSMTQRAVPPVREPAPPEPAPLAEFAADLDARTHASDGPPEPDAPSQRPASAAAVLQSETRARLETVLADIEGVKAGIDRLLMESS